MVHNLKITAIVENTAGTFDAAGEWGLALWIEADQHRILCDTGQGHTLRRNAHLLGIDLATADALVISHGHFDHTGGIAELIDTGFRGPIYAHPAALRPKYHCGKAAPHRQVGIPPASQHALSARLADLIPSEQPTEVAPDILVTGAIPRRNAYEDANDCFFLDEACAQPDPLVDDQALLIETRNGWVVITGCGHAGLINSLDYAGKLTGGSRIFAVLGGFHLFGAPAERIAATVEGLQRFGPKLLAPCHCTGFEATAALHNKFAGQVVALRAGLTLDLGPHINTNTLRAACEQ